MIPELETSEKSEVDGDFGVFAHVLPDQLRGRCWCSGFNQQQIQHFKRLLRNLGVSWSSNIETLDLLFELSVSGRRGETHRY